MDPLPVIVSTTSLVDDGSIPGFAADDSMRELSFDSDYIKMEVESGCEEEESQDEESEPIIQNKTVGGNVVNTGMAIDLSEFFSIAAASYPSASQTQQAALPSTLNNSENITLTDTTIKTAPKILTTPTPSQIRTTLPNTAITNSPKILTTPSPKFRVVPAPSKASAYSQIVPLSTPNLKSLLKPITRLPSTAPRGQPVTPASTQLRTVSALQLPSTPTVQLTTPPRFQITTTMPTVPPTIQIPTASSPIQLRTVSKLNFPTTPAAVHLTETSTFQKNNIISSVAPIIQFPTAPAPIQLRTVSGLQLMTQMPAFQLQTLAPTIAQPISAGTIYVPLASAMSTIASGGIIPSSLPLVQLPTATSIISAPNVQLSATGSTVPSLLPVVQFPTDTPIVSTPSVQFTEKQLSFLYPGMRHVGIQVRSTQNNENLKMRVELAQEDLNRLIRKSNVRSKQIAKIETLVEEINNKIQSAGSLRLKKNYKSKLTSDAKHYMSDVSRTLFEWQLRMNGKSQHARRWTREDIKFASELFTQNQDAYTYLAGVMAVPGMRTLFTHEMDFLDEDMAPPSASKESETRAKLLELSEEKLNKDVERFTEMDIDSLLDNMEESFVNTGDVDAELDKEENVHKGLSDIVLNSRNTYVIDLTRLSAQPADIGGNKEPRKVVVYMTVPPSKKKVDPKS